MSVTPKVINTPSVAAVAADGIQLICKARVTVRANISQLVGGAGAGLVGGRLGGRNEALSTVLDTAFSVGGDFAAMPVGDALMRGKEKKKGGKILLNDVFCIRIHTPWDKKNAYYVGNY